MKRLKPHSYKQIPILTLAFYGNRKQAIIFGGQHNNM